MNNLKSKINMRSKVLYFLLVLFIMGGNIGFAQKQSKGEWITVSEDQAVTISYKSNVTTDRQGNHIAWVKAVYRDREWQNYFSSMLGIRTPVVMTKTKARYDENYNYVMVRQVIAYSKSGKVLYNSGDSSAAGWGPVNASDPVGIVGEYLSDQLNRSRGY